MGDATGDVAMQVVPRMEERCVFGGGGGDGGGDGGGYWREGMQGRVSTGTSAALFIAQTDLAKK